MLPGSFEGMYGVFLDGAIACPGGRSPGFGSFTGFIICPLFAATASSDTRGHPGDISPGRTEFGRDMF